VYPVLLMGLRYSSVSCSIDGMVCMVIEAMSKMRI
jgi:hypothetical protein